MRSSARSPKGTRARGSRPHHRGKNVSLIGAIGLNGLITQVSLLGPTDALTFEAFISQKAESVRSGSPTMQPTQALVPDLWEGACVIMDNCSIHKRAEIEALITKADAKLIYLSPYSPDFSPIENCWSKIKNVLRSIGARNYPDLINAIEQAFDRVSLDRIKSWFTHCCHYTSPE